MPAILHCAPKLTARLWPSSPKWSGQVAMRSRRHDCPDVKFSIHTAASPP